MKKLLFILVVCAFGSFACVPVEQARQESLVTVPKYTSIENICNLRAGLTYDQVVQILGSIPYNLLSSQADGYTIYVYKYRTVERKIPSGAETEIGQEVTGTALYMKEQELFVFFKDGKLESYYTTDGITHSPARIITNNTIFVITKDKEIYIDPSSLIKPDAPVEEVKTINVPFGITR